MLGLWQDEQHLNHQWRKDRRRKRITDAKGYRRTKLPMNRRQPSAVETRPLPLRADSPTRRPARDSPEPHIIGAFETAVAWTAAPSTCSINLTDVLPRNRSIAVQPGMLIERK